MVITLLEGSGLRGSRLDVYGDKRRIGWIEWQPDRPRAGWYFEAEDFTLGVAPDGGHILWFLTPYENGERAAMRKFRRQFYLTFGGLV